MKSDFLILGGDGIQGSIVSRFLLGKNYKIHAADLSIERLKRIYPKNDKFNFSVLDINNLKATRKLIREVRPKVVINCAEGDYNLEVYKACLAEKTHVIDLGSDISITKKQLALKSEFLKREIIAITGCGSTPGINNVMLRLALEEFDEVKTIDAGFVWKTNKEKFVTPFSMGSVLYELTEKALYIEEGKLKKIDPVKSAKEKTFPVIGKQTIFLVNHPEIYSFYRYCKHTNKTPQNIYFYAGFPKHSLNILNILVELGFDSKEKAVLIENREIYPTDFLSQMLKGRKIPNSYQETERLWVIVEGKKNKQKKVVEMACTVNTLPKWQKAGSNIDTAFPAAMIGEMIFKEQISTPGSFTPEEIIPPRALFYELQKYGMQIYRNGVLLAADSPLVRQLGNISLTTRV
jgi:saccharopine dehydrogenase-like NADP-dependent oxidoreductase